MLFIYVILFLILLIHCSSASISSTFDSAFIFDASDSAYVDMKPVFPDTVMVLPSAAAI